MRGPLSNEILNTIARTYDYNKNVTFIFTGSEVGLLYDFLKISDASSPLYGRYYHNLTVELFPNDVTKYFLNFSFQRI